MAAPKAPNGVVHKRRAKKRQSRTEVSSSSESDSDSDSDSNSDRNGDVSPKKATESEVEAEAKKPASPSPVPEPRAKRSKKKSKSINDDTPMTDAPQEGSTSVSRKSKTVATTSQEDFGAIYLRKVAAEVADDLDKVREAQDFKANSVPMLIHALKQGESMYSAEEKRRVVGAARQ